jgi:VIT1/CCC1 family predicted Fe2+/Mn2+ transporter
MQTHGHQHGHRHGHHEGHHSGRNGWLRAAVLGANDGLISTAGIVVGVAAANAPANAVLLAGVAGLVAGALSMAAGEYVSVSSQRDSEHADLARERRELDLAPDAEHAELAGIYVARGLDPKLAAQVAEQLMAHDALGAHARDELGITEATRARPLQAALASASSFALGAVPPLLLAALTPAAWRVGVVMLVSLLLLAVLGGVAARLGGAPVAPGAARIAFWGTVAMGVTAVVGHWFGGVG